MIEVLKQQSNGEEFLSVMPPVSQANDWVLPPEGLAATPC
jgi:hypothetical protein